MGVEVGDLLTINSEKYITLKTLVYKNYQYAFVNKITEDEQITNIYCIFEITENEVRMVIEENLKNILLEKFEELLKKDIEN